VVFKPSPNVWGYFSVKGGGGIHEFSDSQVWLNCTFAGNCAIAVNTGMTGDECMHVFLVHSYAIDL
jgi:hypothetical protein